MWILHYFNWAGTPAEFKEFTNTVKTEFAKSEGVNLLGVFTPTSEWHYVIVWDVTAYEKLLKTYKTYSENYGPFKMSLGKLELFHTLEEVPFL